jgi:phospholipid/cholesterol/gamma-HCH transport system substrate-binding protein
MKKYSLETSVGLLVFVGLLCVTYLTIKLGQMELLGDRYYTLKAQFASITGLKPGSSVEMTGVPIGRVDEIYLDQEKQVAVVYMKIKKGVVVTDDAIASVKTSGLIGDKYVKIAPGGSDVVLGEGDLLTETESAIDLEELISKYVFGSM